MAGAGSPCGACKFLRRKCVANCIFAPYFCSEQGAARFAAIHKIFGASNVGKLLQHLPKSERSEAVVTIAYEADARINDPVYGCVSQIFALQQQVATLQAQVMQAKAQLARSMAEMQMTTENQWPRSNLTHSHQAYPYMITQEGSVITADGAKEIRVREEAAANQIHGFEEEASPKCSIDCIDSEAEMFPAVSRLETHNRGMQSCNLKWLDHDEMGDLQALPFRITDN